MEPHLPRSEIAETESPFFVYRKSERISAFSRGVFDSVVLSVLISIIFIGLGIAVRGLYNLGVFLS